MRKIFFGILLLFITTANAQAPEKWSSADIYNNIKKLNFLGSVLYVAAHPDDENTRMISYLSNAKHARTAYLSLTRGDGGQNLIGSEIGAQLGIIRTQELLAARRIDGGEQFFTRANDFGYSKNPKETLQIWNKDTVLSDVVWIFRKFRPDVVINRFDHRTPGSTHGHHTSSAMLSVEAFELSGNDQKYQDQLKYVEAYQPKRMFFNTSSWFYDGQEAFQEAAKKLTSFDIGTYYPLKGLSNPEIAALSRSEHKSQGFGSSGSRGKQMEYLELVKGDSIQNKNDLFEGIDTTWSRIDGGEAIGKILYDVEENFDFSDPSKSLDKLVEAYQLIQNIKDDYWRELKTSEIEDIIYASSGLFLEARAQQPTVTPGEQLSINLEAINRSAAGVILKSVALSPNDAAIYPNESLKSNEEWNSEMQFSIPNSAKFTNAYWLEKEQEVGMYHVDDRKLVGLPETPENTTATFTIFINGMEIEYQKPIIFKYTDDVKGEVYENFDIVPAVSISMEDQVLIFSDEQPKEVSILVRSNEGAQSGSLKLNGDQNWTVKPEKQNFSIATKGGTARLNFTVSAPSEQNESTLTATATVNGKSFDQSLIEIDYDHISNQNLLAPAELKVVKLDIRKKGENIAYIEGAGDVVPESLEQIGYKVTRLAPSQISASALQRFDAVVLGIRAFNVVEELKFRKTALFDYVQNGGTLIVQYNTNRGLVTDDIAPLPLQLSRDRVTDEFADVTFLDPNNPVLNSPNKLNSADFENWVQERGLYFAGSWDEKFTPVLSMNDEGETPKTGSLLVAKYGKGYYIYSGISFFRQFPAAVPGAFRLFANLLSIGK